MRVRCKYSWLEGTPNEVKLKYLADNDFRDLSGQELKDAISQRIKEKKDDLVEIWRHREQPQDGLQI